MRKREDDGGLRRFKMRMKSKDQDRMCSRLKYETKRPPR